jgi:serine/threonine-protein kinase
MAFHSRACDERRLDKFLHDQLPEDSQRDVEAHLLICPACRDKLDQLAGGPLWWTEVRHYLGGDGAAEALHTWDSADAHQGRTMELDFLEPTDKPGSLGRLGGYEVLEVLGQGGMGVVLKAFDQSLHRPVAIKVLSAEYAASGAARKRFAREAQAAAAVIHDHVVPVHAVDATATPPFLVMAFIPGQSLQQRIDRSGPLELKEILRISMQTAAGLAAAHAQGLVHRDIKPANIMLENGIERVRITDFGLARAVDDASISQSGVVAGTPQYMAPEQAGGESVDQRADLFALGSTMYFMCTGRAPFRSESGLAVIRQVCDVEPVSIRSINPDVPIWLGGIVRRLHAKDPSKRFQSATEVADLLEHCLAHVQQPHRNPLPKLAEELGRQAPGAESRKPSIGRWAAIATLMVGLLVGIGLLIGFGRGIGRHAAVSGETTSESIIANYDDQFFQESSQLRNSLEGLRESLSTPSSTESNNVQREIGIAHLRAEHLRSQLNESNEADFDSVQTGLENIRGRLERMQRDLKGISSNHSDFLK